MTADLARRRSLLVPTLAALRVKTPEPELTTVHRWLDNWTGLGLIATGMERQGYRAVLAGYHSRAIHDRDRPSAAAVRSSTATDRPRLHPAADRPTEGES